MSKKKDRLQIVITICNAAAVYKKNLIGRTFLCVFDNRYFEVIFRKNDFKHLTGVDSNLSATQFFKNASNRQLTTEQIFFSSLHPYYLCQRKLKHISDLSNLVFSDTFVLEDINTSTQYYKFGSTNLHFTVCFNQDPKPNPNPAIDSPYHAYSLRDEDCFKKSKNVYEVSHIFSKNNDKPFYNTLVYHDKRFEHSKLPIVVVDKLHTELKTQLRIQC